jgi:hypothetical protein
MVLHVIWNGVSVDAKQLTEYCRPYTIECNALARSNPIGVTLVSSMKIFTERRMLTEIAVPNTDDNILNYLASTEASFQMTCKTISSISKIDICSF